MKKGILVVAALILLVGGIVSWIKLRPHEKPLASWDIFAKDKVDAAIAFADENGKLSSKKLFMQGIDLYRNKKQAAKSLEWFEKSIRVYPTPKAYYELGNAAMDAGKYKLTDSAYDMAEYLKYDPISNLSYNRACLSFKQKDEYSGESLLELAFGQGYSNKKHFQSDPDLVEFRKTDKYKVFLAKYFPDAGYQLALFNLFIDKFPPQSLPYELKDMDGAAKLDNSISYDYADFVNGMEDTRFARMTTNEFVYTARLLKGKITAVLYTSVNLQADTLAPLITKLVTYDSAGKYVDDILFACRCTPSDVTNGRMEEDSTIITSQFLRNWKFDPYAKGYKGNEITGLEPRKTRTYKLCPDGKFKEIEQKKKEEKTVMN